jgi:hypothetical protein
VHSDILQNKETDEAKRFLNSNMATAEYCCCFLHSNYGFFVTQYAELVAGGKTQTKCGPAGLQRDKETWSVAEKTFRWALCNARARMKPSHMAGKPGSEMQQTIPEGFEWNFFPPIRPRAANTDAHTNPVVACNCRADTIWKLEPVTKLSTASDDWLTGVSSSLYLCEMWPRLTPGSFKAGGCTCPVTMGTHDMLTIRTAPFRLSRVSRPFRRPAIIHCRMKANLIVCTSSDWPILDFSSKCQHTFPWK